MPTFECKLCEYSTLVKCNYMKHVETKKHMQMAELLPHLDLPPTELERLRLENKQLKQQIKILLTSSK